MNLLDSSLYRADLARAIGGFSLAPLKDKRILITGGFGLIGSSIVDLLILANEQLDLGLTIYVAARSRTKYEESYRNYHFVEFVQYDATQALSFHFPADYIIHGASPASPDQYTANPVETMLSNIQGISNLLLYAQKEQVVRVLYISSSEVYGKKETAEPFVEGVYGSVDIDAIRSSYPVSKQAAELLCKAFSSEYGVDTVIVRPGHIFGPTASPRDQRVSSDFAYKAAKHLPLVLKSSGMQERSYCYTVDAAAAILFVLLHGKSAESYNIGTDEVCSIRKMAEIYSQIGNVPLEYKEPTKEELLAFNPMNHSSLNCEKLKSLGFRSSFSVKEGLAHTVTILRELPT